MGDDLVWCRRIHSRSIQHMAKERAAKAASTPKRDEGVTGVEEEKQRRKRIRIDIPAHLVISAPFAFSFS